MSEEIQLITDVPGLPSGVAWHWGAVVDRFVFTAGQVAWDAEGRLVGKGSASEQTEQAFRNLKNTLEAAGSSMDKIVKVTAYLTDPSTLAAVREVRNRWLKTRPPSTFVFVSQLVDPDLLIEIEAIAIRG